MTCCSALFPAIAIINPRRAPHTTVAAAVNADNGAPAVAPTRRGRKKSPAPASPSSTAPRKSRSKKKPVDEFSDPADEDFDDGMDFPYESPPLICCFGAAQLEFVPSVRVSDRRMHPDQYSSWKGLQWSPPEFARAPGGSPSNVAISHARLGGRAAFMGKVGDDDFGNDLVLKMNLEKVQTRAVKIDPSVKTAASYMRIEFKDDDGGGQRMIAETVRDCAEDSLLRSELNLSVLKEAARQGIGIKALF